MEDGLGAELSKLASTEYLDWLDKVLKGQTKVCLTFDTTWWKSGRRRPTVGRWEGKPFQDGSEWVVSEWVAYGMFRRWIAYLNTLVIGDGYKKHWKHSYFGYLMGKEYQTRGVIHFHVVIDNWYPWKQATEWWWRNCGAMRQERIEDNREAIKYALKYALKSGSTPDIWLPNRRWVGKPVVIVDVDEMYQKYMNQPFDTPDGAGGEVIPGAD